jgi:hypothetical protein
LQRRGSGALSKPSRRKSKKEQLAEDLRNSDLTAQAIGGRDDIVYGPHDSLPTCGEHVSRMKRG